jgi:vitellogenic carboxypeptidase-like protein
MCRQERIFAGRFKMLLLAFIAWSFVNTASCFLNVYPKIKQISFRGDPGEPLYLTPLIEAGKIKEAQDAAKVGPLKGAENITSFSGYLTVNKKFNSNLFFWFFPVEVRNVCHMKLNLVTYWTFLGTGN